MIAGEYVQSVFASGHRESPGLTVGKLTISSAGGRRLAHDGLPAGGEM